ncbi:Stromal processing peptidase, chloroplastic [Zea mays]|uniref:Stromal processing peptidase, chloroplastic n=1 Tax=Zea mays TaxID=4577 RepID=A0A3L6FJC0_MAIZE|nr:Stromal processing peptidase, chloroplastic [Zea mays]
MLGSHERRLQILTRHRPDLPEGCEGIGTAWLRTCCTSPDPRPEELEPRAELSPCSLQKLTLQSVKYAVMNQFVGGNMEVSIVVDFTEEKVEYCVLDDIDHDLRCFVL